MAKDAVSPCAAASAVFFSHTVCPLFAPFAALRSAGRAFATGGCFSENLLLCFRGSGYAPEQSTPEESESADVCIKRMLSVEDALAGWDFVNRNVFPLSEICMMRTNNSSERLDF